MQFSDLVAAVQDTVDADTTDDAVTTRIKRYLNWAQQDIASRKNWDFLKSSDSFDTVDGTEEYTLDSLVHKIQRLKDATSNRYLSQVDIDQFSKDYPEPSSEGSPKIWYATTLDSSGNHNIKLYPIPDDVYTINYDFLTRLSDMVNDTDVSKIPKRYHQSLVDYACWHYWEKEQDPQANYYASKFENEVLLMMSDYQDSDAMPSIKPSQREGSFVTGKIGRIYN